MSLKNFSDKLRKLAHEVETGTEHPELGGNTLQQRDMAEKYRKWAAEVESDAESDPDGSE